MKKDYIFSGSYYGMRDEAVFVEHFWTDVWEKRSCQSFGNTVKAREEIAIISPYLRCFSRGARVLDGGCGFGDLTVYFSSQGFNVVGIDICEKIIAKLKQFHPGIDFQVGDIRAMGFSSGSFDAYFSFGAFEHFENGLDACFAEANRILKNNGLFFVSVPFLNRRHLVASFFEDVPRSCEGLHFYQWRLTKKELASQLEKHGFICRKIYAIHKTEGARRLLHSFLRIPYEHSAMRVLGRILPFFFPSNVIAHMMLGVGIKK